MKTLNPWHAALYHQQIAFEAVSEFNFGRAEKHRIKSMEHIAIAHNFGISPGASDEHELKRRQSSLGIIIENAKRGAAVHLDDVVLLDG